MIVTFFSYIDVLGPNRITRKQPASSVVNSALLHVLCYFPLLHSLLFFVVLCVFFLCCLLFVVCGLFVLCLSFVLLCVFFVCSLFVLSLLLVLCCSFLLFVVCRLLFFLVHCSLFFAFALSLARVARRPREVTQKNSTIRQLAPTKGQVTMALLPCTPFLITNTGRRSQELGALRVLPLAQQRNSPLVLLRTRSSTAGRLQKQPWRTVLLTRAPHLQHHLICPVARSRCFFSSSTQGRA